MASDIPVHREVGDVSCQYFDIRDPNSLASMVMEHYEKRTASKLAPRSGTSSNHHMTTWSESAEELLTLVLDIYREKQVKSRLISRAA
jgi:hypothetical protein